MVKEDKYEYHKQNDYPGERVAEKKRVAEREEAEHNRSNARVAEKGRTDELKADNRVAQKGRSDELIADNRVARKGRMDEEILESQKERSEEKARVVNENRNTADATGMMIIGGILILLIGGLVWTFVTIGQQSSEINALTSQASNPAEQQPGVIQTPIQQNPVVTTPPTQSDYQAGLTLAKNFVMQASTYRFDGSNLQFNRSITLSPQDCGGIICYQYVYEFVSSHSGYGDRTGQNLPINMTEHQMVVTVRNATIYDAYVDHTWNTETQQLLIPAP